eukprot:5963304-Karenia_brevis.AAC.1
MVAAQSPNTVSNGVHANSDKSSKLLKIKRGKSRTLIQKESHNSKKRPLEAYYSIDKIKRGN